jgi:Fe-S oxidoreductase
MPKPLKVEDFGKHEGEQLTSIEIADLVPLPPPYDKIDEQPEWKQIKKEHRNNIVCNLDGVVACSLPHPKDEAEEREVVEKFVSGLQKLLTKENNWTFLQPLMLTLEYCAKCQTCADACHTYEMSGQNDLYRPTYRAEVWRRLVNKYAKDGPEWLAKFQHGDIDLNWTTVSRLYELVYRCNMCRRCAQACPMGVDNALITHELRKLFSQELGWAPKELHEKGTMLQLQVGSSTGMNQLVVKDNIEFVDEDFTEQTGFNAKTTWDKEGADVLLIHNASYDGVNYGLFYDDFQLARIALKHASTAKKLNANKIVAGECGHQHKAMITIGDRILLGELDINIESCMPLLEKIVFSGKIEFNPSQNDFPVTLHDPCNLARNLGIIEPQRRILRYLCPQFREMEPHGVENYCCGGGSGFAIMSGNNFTDWRAAVNGRKKFKQILDAFSDQPSPEVKKYICAPCSNCKGQFRDILEYFGAREKSGITYGGLVELIVNAMVGIKEPYIKWDE